MTDVTIYVVTDEKEVCLPFITEDDAKAKCATLNRGVCLRSLLAEKGVVCTRTLNVCLNIPHHPHANSAKELLGITDEMLADRLAQTPHTFVVKTGTLVLDSS